MRRRILYKKSCVIFLLITKLVMAVFLTLFFISCSSVKSSSLFKSNYLGSATTIPPFKNFELGGNGNGAFSVEVRNVGKKPVTISQRQSDGKVTLLGQLNSGAKLIFQFSEGSTAIFTNTSNQSAELGLKVVGDMNLRMGYASEK
jgi:hypothetical protein